MRNLHKAYYKDYFENLNFGYLLDSGKEPKDEIIRRNKWFTEPIFEPNLRQRIPKNQLVNQFFELKIAYPGLVTGIGIDHEAKIEGEFKLGVHFDWTYGMPVVYGSSVKGVLRSAFIEEQKNGKIIKYDNYFLNEMTKKEWSQDEIKILFDAIFEGRDAKGNNLSVYDRDIFFDAVIVEPDKDKRILCSDSITPHTKGPLKNPNPITFLKIAPGCTIEFRFKLVKTSITLSTGKTVDLSAEEKLGIFKEILTTVGIGAKTNVGYGQLEAIK